MIYALGELIPDIHPSAFIHPDAVIIGAVVVGAESSIWPMAVLRGDYGKIAIGSRTSIQDGTVIHAVREWVTSVGSRSIVGHNAHLEGCQVGDGCLVGSGSVVLNGAVVEDGGSVGASALVSMKALIRTGEIAVGVPAQSRPVAGLGASITEGVELYVQMGRRYRSELRRLA